MNKNVDRMDPSRKSAALQRLAETLAALDASQETSLNMESDMLSLIISGTLHGDDIAQRYPAFYKKLLENAKLRQAFLEALGSVEAERTGEMLPLPAGHKADLSFLNGSSSKPIIETVEKQGWRVTWQRTLEQLQALFSPPELAYRADHADIEEPWFMLLRDEMTAVGITYDVLLDCTLSSEKENFLSTFVNLAVTLDQASGTATFPLRASLHWGDYQESVLVAEEGRFRFPDIPLDSVIDPADSQLRAGFSLRLETIS